MSNAVTDEMVSAYKAAYSLALDEMFKSGQAPTGDMSREATRAGLAAALSHPPQAPVGAVKALDEALANMDRCVHDGGFDREIGPIGCNLGDNCVCIGVYPKVNEARHSLVSSVKEEPDYVLCPCTTFEQDEDCPIGYPSMLCSACGGKGHAPMDKVVALAAEMMKIAEQVDELEDPFAAWESVSLLQSQNDQFRKALESSAPVKGEDRV